MHTADAWHLRGLQLAETGATEAAASCFGEALALRPDAAVLWADLGVCLHRLGRLTQAEAVLRRALRLAPGLAQGLACLGLVLAASGRTTEAVAALRGARGAAPDDPAILTNLGNLLGDAGHLAEAEATLRAALALRPVAADAHHNLAVVLAAAGRLDEAARCCRVGLHHDPAHADCRYTLGITDLLAGRLAAGWEGFAWRGRRRDAPPPRGFACPAWDGGDRGDRRLLLHAEQGLGDAIQMLRFVPAVAARGPVVLEVPPPLLRWARGLPGAAEVYAAGEATPPPFDLHCSLMDLPRLLGVTLATIPPPVAPRLGRSGWAGRVAALPGRRVGLAWAGNPRYAADARRSLPARGLDGLGDVAGISFVSLQKDAAARPGLAMQDWTAELTDLAETAALVAALDLVITVDSAVAHLAATLGRPVWLLNRFDTCWRWLRVGEDSAWYPSLRIFRQAAPGDWDGVMAAVRAALLSRAW